MSNKYQLLECIRWKWKFVWFQRNRLFEMSCFSVFNPGFFMNPRRREEGGQRPLYATGMLLSDSAALALGRR